MTTQPCDGCGTSVKIAGGIADLWSFSHDPTEGITLEFESDGTEHFLCFECVERLPEDPTAADVETLEADGDSG